MIVQLVSGGLDSELVSHAYQANDVIRLFVNYGQKECEQEWEAVRQLWPEAKRIDIIGQKPTQDGVVYPARNMLLANIAVTYFKADTVLLGGMQDDNCVDKNAAAFAQMSRTLSDQTGMPIRVLSPFWNTDKSKAVAEYLKTGGSKERLLQTFSCYSPDSLGNMCKSCQACFRWAVALCSNGIEVVHPGIEITKSYLTRLHEYSEGRRWAILKTISSAREILVFDLDGTLTLETEGWDYHSRTVCETTRRKINKSYSTHWIILWSSRREMDREVTKQWLEDNKVRYHALLLDKIPYDQMTDDKASKCEN